MAKKNQMSFLFPADQDLDHPDSQLAMDYRNGHSREQGATWDDPHQVLQTRKSPALPFSSYQKRKRKKHSFVGSSASRKRKRRTPFSFQHKRTWQGLLTAGTAILVGLIMGLTVLSVFSNLAAEDQPTNVEGDTPTEMTPEIGSSSPEASPDIVPSGSVQDGVVQIPERSYFVVQAGAFSELEQAEEISARLTENDLSGLLLREGDIYRLYVGVTSAKEQTDTIAHQVQEQGFETYVREHVIPDVSGAQVNVEEETLSALPSFVAAGDQLVAELGVVTTSGLQSPDYTLTDEAWEAIQDRHYAFLEEGKQVFQDWPGEGKEIGQKMMQEMNSALQALETYRSGSHSSYLWMVQQAALNYMQQYEQFISTLNTT